MGTAASEQYSVVCLVPETFCTKPDRKHAEMPAARGAVIRSRTPSLALPSLARLRRSTGCGKTCPLADRFRQPRVSELMGLGHDRRRQLFSDRDLARWAHDHDPRPASGGPRWLASCACTDKRANAPLSLPCGQTR